MRACHVWWLNFGAEVELERPTGYNPSQEVLARGIALREATAALRAPGDVVLGPPLGAVESTVPGAPGLAWCPTPSAVRALRSAGAALAEPPPLAVLQRVNHRALCNEIGPTLEGATFARDAGAVAAAIRRTTPSGTWLLKRPFGFAGRGQRRVRVGTASADDRVFIEAALRRDGLQVEPWVPRAGDYAMHGFVARSGEVTLGEPCGQLCSEQGVWQRMTRAHDLSEAEAEALRGAAKRTGAALHRQGYHGPFGIDAFRYLWDGAERFHPLCEINARYTMGWAAGMGDRRPDL